MTASDRVHGRSGQRKDAERRRYVVLVTGASSGIGRACALRLDERGLWVYAGVRSEAAAAALVREASSRLTAVLLDVTNERAIATTVAQIAASLGDGDAFALVNNAGTVLSGPLEFTSNAALGRQLEVNVIAPVAVTRACLPLLRRHSGRIVNVGSTSGRISSAFLGPYCASKFALEALTEALRLELAAFGIHVCMVEPGVVATPLWKKTLQAEERALAELPEEGKAWYGEALRRRGRLLRRLATTGMSPEKIAEAVHRALSAKRPRRRYVVGWGARIRTSLVRWLPDRWRDALTVLRAAGASAWSR